MTIMRNKGFTLVELALSITIIGILIAGVIKGQELLQNSRLTSTISQAKAIDAAVTTFRDMNDALPGDIANPASRLSNCTNDPCIRGGNQDGIIGVKWASLALGGAIVGADDVPEIYEFWLHLAAANLLNGIDSNTTTVMPTNYGTLMPSSKLGGGFYVGNFGWSTTLQNQQPLDGLYLILSNRPPGSYGTLGNDDGFKAQAMETLDIKMDDGIPVSGDIRTYMPAGCSSADQMHYNSNPGNGDWTTCAPMIIRIQG